jgi:hypothetical protein
MQGGAAGELQLVLDDETLELTWQTPHQQLD